MNNVSAFGWRKDKESYSSGLDFLGLAVPIERILDRWTPGMTNATNRVRFFSFIPWIVHQYAIQGRQGSLSEQRVFIRAFETFFALANAANEYETGISARGGIRMRYARKKWKGGKNKIAIRGPSVPSSPSAFDPANYGPSFSRFHLIGKNGRLRTCLEPGIVMAEVFSESVPGIAKMKSLFSGESISRSQVLDFHKSLNLHRIPRKELNHLRKLVFAERPFDFGDTLNRVRTLLLLLSVISGSKQPLAAFEIESVIAGGRYSTRRRLKVPACLEQAYARWRIITMLKFLRHSAEIAFKGLHIHIGETNEWFRIAGDAAAKVAQMAAGEIRANSFENLVADDLSNYQLPKWEIDEHDNDAVDKVCSGVSLLSWCAARIQEEQMKPLLEDSAGRIGDQLNAGLSSYAWELKQAESLSVENLIRWLLIDRGLARHNRVAAKKLWQHNTFRVVDDEHGAISVGQCPIPNIAVRVGSMLSTLADLKILQSENRSYSLTAEGSRYFDQQMKSLIADQ